MSWGIAMMGFDAAMGLIEDVGVDYSGETVYIAAPTVEYAIYQELGTSKMEARPFVRPAAEYVQANTESEIRRISTSQGIPLVSEEAIVRCAALAVQDRMKRIADRKDIRDTGTLIATIEIERVS
ncbi:hypothetical protein [Haloarcula montana]|uniref:hypothetical protein n=1 Tax=Haloarcula montana TaxID=3111776 RepID=UPI002D781A1E|nr:hypothetical protein [Haloarcula sp. GH36]